ncbi:MAG: DEAD/DEAH box helicase family protein [Nitrososphaerales archaeon]
MKAFESQLKRSVCKLKRLRKLWKRVSIAIDWHDEMYYGDATPQVVRNDLREGRLSSLKDFGLVVFDECHRSVKEYAYTEVAETYANSSSFPLILGMTASPGSDIKKIMIVCASLLSSTSLDSLFS